MSSIGARSPLKDRRLLKFERHRSMKVSRTLRLTETTQPALPTEIPIKEDDLKVRIVRFDPFRQMLALQNLKMLITDQDTPI